MSDLAHLLPLQKEREEELTNESLVIAEFGNKIFTSHSKDLETNERHHSPAVIHHSTTKAKLKMAPAMGCFIAGAIFLLPFLDKQKK